MRSRSKRRLCLAGILLSATAAWSSMSIFSSTGLLTHRLPITRSSGKSTGSRLVTLKNARTEFFITPHRSCHLNEQIGPCAALWASILARSSIAVFRATESTLSPKATSEQFANKNRRRNDTFMSNSDRRTLKNVGSDECLCFRVRSPKVLRRSERKLGVHSESFSQVFICRLSQGTVCQRCFVPGKLENITQIPLLPIAAPYLPWRYVPTHHTCQDSSWER